MRKEETGGKVRHRAMPNRARRACRALDHGSRREVGARSSLGAAITSPINSETIPRSQGDWQRPVPAGGPRLKEGLVLDLLQMEDRTPG